MSLSVTIAIEAVVDTCMHETFATTYMYSVSINMTVHAHITSVGLSSVLGGGLGST